MKSEKIIQERQNKERNKASVSIDDIAGDVVKAETVAAEEVRQKFKPIGKIDLDSLNRKKVSRPWLKIRRKKLKNRLRLKQK